MGQKIAAFFFNMLAKVHYLQSLYTGKSLSEALIFASTLTHNMTTDCSLNYKFNTWKFQAQTWGEHVVYRNCFWHSEQFLYTTCSLHVRQKEDLLTKIYLYQKSFRNYLTFKSRKFSWCAFWRGSARRQAVCLVRTYIRTLRNVRRSTCEEPRSH